VRVLRRRQEANGTAEWVFPGNGPGGHLGPPRKQWAALLDRAGVKDLRLHDLRRTLGSWMANTGASVVMTQRALGHKTIDASLIYQRLQLKPVRLSMQKAVAGLLAAAKDKEPLTIEARPAQGKSGI
jgi:integrase